MTPKSRLFNTDQWLSHELLLPYITIISAVYPYSDHALAGTRIGWPGFGQQIEPACDSLDGWLAICPSRMYVLKNLLERPIY